MESNEGNNDEVRSENVDNATFEALNEGAKKVPSKEEALQILGITEERTLELRDVMLAAADRLKEKGLPLGIPTIVNETADYVNNTREAVFVGLIFGQTMNTMSNPLMGLLNAMSRMAKKEG